MKKFLSILLVVVFIVTVVPLGTFDVEINALSTSGDCSYSHYNLGCDTDGICPYCGYRGPAPGHVFVETDDGYVCDVCGYILEAEEDTTVNGTLNGNDSVEVGETIELTVKVENCENATSVAVRLTLGDSFEFVSGSWLKSGSLNTFDTKTLKGALGGLTSPNVNGDLFKFVLKATKATNGEDVTVNVIAKNGATEIMNTNAVKTVKVTEAEVLAPNCTLNGADSVDVGDTIELTVKVENCESATSLSVAVILGDSFELVSGQWIKSGSIMKFDLGTKKGALGGLASPDVNGDVLKFVLKATKVAADGEDIVVNVIAKNGSTEIMNVTAAKTVNVIYVEPAGAISALNGNDSVEIGNTIELTVNVKDCENATSVAVAITLGDSFELVFGEWIKGGSIKMFDLSSKKGALGSLTSPNINGDLFKFVLKATKAVANGEDVTVNVIAKNGSTEIMNVNAVKTVKVVCTNHIYDGCDAECNLCGYIREEIHTFTNECDRDCNLCGESRKAPHKYNNACDATCDLCGIEREVGEHIFSGVCDFNCNECGAIRKAESHTYATACDKYCTVCGYVRAVSHKYDNNVCTLCGYINECKTLLTSDFSDSSKWMGTTDGILAVNDGYATITGVRGNPIGIMSSSFPVTAGKNYEVTFSLRIPQDSASYNIGGNVFAPSVLLYKQTTDDEGKLTLPKSSTAKEQNNMYSYTVQDGSWVIGEGFRSVWTVGNYLPIEVTDLSGFHWKHYAGMLAQSGDNDLKVVASDWITYRGVFNGVGEGTENVAFAMIFDGHGNPTGFKFDIKDFVLREVNCPHEYTKVEGAKDATCFTYGYTGDAYCTVCGEKVKDGEVIIAHTYTNECDFECNLCGEIRNAPHKFSASCDEVCDGCGYSREASEPHIYTNACDADCDACGVIRTVDHLYTNSCDIDCNLCGAVRTITHTFTNECDAECDVCYETRKAPHKYDAICDAECNLCGKTRVAADHTYDNACDENCNECNEARTPPHYYSWVVDKENNCGVDGFKHEECVACHATQNENTIIPATGNHGFEWIVDKQNNCGVDGLKHEECVVCHTTRNNNVVVPATGDHTYDNACDAYCNVCNLERTVPDHVYSNPCDIDCNVCSSVRKAVHLFANNCDPECNLCGSIRAVPDHIYTDEYDSTCDECGYLRVTPGNVDGDDEINDSDVEYLLMFTFFPEEYPVNQNCDFDGDGEVNDQDAGYLLMFIFFLLAKG